MITTVVVSLGSTLFSSFYPLLPFLWTLSLSALKKLYLWKFFTYLFIDPSTSITLSYLIRLGFTLYLLWSCGTLIVERFGEKSFACLYFLSGLCGGVLAFLVLNFFSPFTYFGGTFVPLYAILIAWVMLNPYSKILLFFVVPLSAKWLILGLLGGNLLIELSHSNFVPFVAYLASGVIGYFYALFVWKVKSPFFFLNPMEERIIFFAHKFSFSKVKIWWPKRKKLTDEEFIDKMLEKIAQKGTRSLSFWEKRRLHKIPKNKK